MEEMILTVWQQNGRERALELIRQVSGTAVPNACPLGLVWRRTGQSRSALQLRMTNVRLLVIEKRISVEARDPDGTTFLHTYWPVAVSDARQGGLELSRSKSELEQTKRSVIYRTFFQVGATALLAGLFVVLAASGSLGGRFND